MALSYAFFFPLSFGIGTGVFGLGFGMVGYALAFFIIPISSCLGLMVAGADLRH